MLSQALNISVHPAQINGTKRIYHATFRLPCSESAVSMLSFKKTPLKISLLTYSLHIFGPPPRIQKTNGKFWGKIPYV